MNASDLDTLCARCSVIDLEAVMLESQRLDSSDLSIRIGTLVADLGPVSAWQVKTCGICRVLVESVPRTSCENPPDNYSLRFHYASDKRLRIYYPILGALATTATILKLDKTDDTAHYVSSPFLVLQRSDDTSRVRILESSSIEFSYLRDWLDTCRQMHTKTCCSSAAILVSSLKLIDCTTRTVVRADPAKSQPYVTLSYVCGTIDDPPHAPDRLPSPAPETIEDAIRVTLSLNLRYLWVDRYCIDQLNTVDKLAQIQQMNLIYSTSEVTLIAAAGKDAYYGLPGVGMRSRIQHSHSKPNGFQLVSTMQPIGPVYGDLGNSHWSTRAWCYQEALLSKRRLIFTDEQVYYECHGMSCCEVLDLPYREMHREGGQSFREEYQYFSTREVGTFTAGVGKAPYHLFTRIEEYTKKDISFQSDRLNAFLGILNRFETKLHSSRHLWGQPMVPEQNLEGYMANASISALNRAKNWFGLGSFVDGLTWAMHGCGGRESHRPSWSWTGWPHPTRYRFIFSSTENPGEFPAVQIEFEVENGKVLDWNELQNWYPTTINAAQSCRILHISAMTLPIRLVEYETAGRFFELDLKDGFYIEWLATTVPETADSKSTTWLMRDDLPSDTQFQALMIAPNFFEAEPTLIFLMIIAEVGRLTERVGGGWLGAEMMLCNSDGDEIHVEEHGEWISGLKAKYGDNWWRSLAGEFMTHRVQ